MADDKDIIKSVRVRKSHKLNDDFTSDIKVTISKSGLFNNKRKVVGESNNNLIWPAITYDMNGRYEYYDDKAFLDDFISTNAKLEGSEYVKDLTNSGFEIRKYTIAQDPWNDYYSTKYRSFSFDYYFLSNGATVVIKWLLEKWDEDRKQTLIYQEGGEQWSDDKGNELDVESIPDGKNIDGTPKVLKKEDIYKRVEIRDSREKGSNERLLFSWNSDKFYDEKDESAANKAASEKIDGKIPDKWILDKIIREWTSKVPSYEGKLLVCLNSDGTVVGGSYNPTSIEDPPNSDKYVKNDWMKLEWISPINPPAKLPEPVTEDNKPTGMSSSKIKLNVVLPPDFKVVVKQDTKDVKVYVGDPPKVEVPGGFIFTEELEVLDDEYAEIDISPEDLKIQDEIAGGQEDCSTPVVEQTTTDNTTVISDPVVSKPLSSLDTLLDLAGECARSLGKNARVNAENMKMRYTKGIHGLCPQGTQAVLYALTGVKSLGQISGNADWFSFGPTNPIGGDNKASFSKSGYFQDKVKISQSNGTWKGTYMTTKKMWQVGDVVAMAYSGEKDYGHIQVWTGNSWMSDFRQGDSIQQNHVNPNSVALWRLNEKGLQALKNRTSIA